MFKTLILIFVISLSALQVKAQVNQEWVRTDTNLDTYVFSVDNDGNSFVAGKYKRVFNTGEIYFKKIDINGNQVWDKHFWDSTYIYGTGEVTSIMLYQNQYVYLTGPFYDTSSHNTEFVTLKYDTSGTLIWFNKFPISTNGMMTSPIIGNDNQGNILVACAIAGSGGYDFDYALVKYNSSGGFLWMKRYDGTGHYADMPTALCIDYNNNIIVTGESCDVNGWNPSSIATLKYDQNGNLIWLKRISGYNRAFGSDLATDNSGSIYLLGTVENPLTETITIKYNSNGDSLWSVRYPGVGFHLGLDQSLNVYISGNTRGQVAYYDFLTAKYSNSGNLLWVNKYNGPFNDDDRSSGMFLSNNGDVYVTGTSRDSSDNYTEIATMKYYSNGSIAWTARYRTNNNSFDGSKGVLVSNNKVLVLGQYNGTNSLLIKYSQPIGIQPISSEIPNHFSLSQNFPNPFNPETKIKFDIPNQTNQNAVLKIFDVLGKEVATLVNEKLKPGKYEVSWNAADYPSGVYFYRLNAGDYIETKKMVLLK